MLDEVDELLPRMDAELTVDMLDVRAHGIRADEYELANKYRTTALREKQHDLRFAFGK